jgi:D-xylose transport system permease protein
VIIQDKVIIGLANYFLPPFWGWVVAMVFVVGYALVQTRQVVARQKQALPIKPISIVNGPNRRAGPGGRHCRNGLQPGPGRALCGVILLVFLVFFSFLATRTPLGVTFTPLAATKRRPGGPVLTCRESG